VLYPGLILPLHIFEDRYRALVRDLLALPDEAGRRFGVVCIRGGSEVGVGAATALHEVGCTAELTQVAPHPDGRFDIVTVGGRRFRISELTDGRPYLTAHVEVLDEPDGDSGAVGAIVAGVQRTFRTYLERLGAARGAAVEIPDLPADGLTLSYLVAATMVLDLPDKQALLAAPDTISRLTAEQRLLRREAGLLAVLPTAPAPDLARVTASPN
jgi:Lon protease-like protein